MRLELHRGRVEARFGKFDRCRDRGECEPRLVLGLGRGNKMKASASPRLGRGIPRFKRGFFPKNESNCRKQMQLRTVFHLKFNK